MTVRDERAAALTRRHRDLSDDFTRALPGLLDDLEAIDRAQVPGGIVPFEGDLTEEQAAEFERQWAENFKGTPTDAQLAAWIERNPKAFADWAAKQVKVSARTAPAPRRRTTR